MKRSELNFSVCYSSAKTFAMQMTWFDALLSVMLCAAAGGFVFVRNGALPVWPRAAFAFLAAVSAYSSFVIVRALVPFVLHFSFAHMMRLRLPFYVWTVSLLVTAGVCGASELFSAPSADAVQFALILAAVMLTVRFFQSGSLLRLTLAFSCAGGAVGLSIMGLFVPSLMFFLMWAMGVRTLVRPNFTCWEDKLHPRVVEYFTNPLVRSRMKWMFVGCFLLCAGLAFRLVLREAGGFIQAGHAWFGCLCLDGAAFILMTAILPLIVGLGKVRISSDVVAHDDFFGLTAYMAIVPLTALFMVKPGLLPSLAQLDLHIEAQVLALTSVVYVFNMLLAGVVILADIRCRDFRGVAGVRFDNLRYVMRFSYTVASLAPLALTGYAVFLHLQ